jgi:hypothetical protein
MFMRKSSWLLILGVLIFGSSLFVSGACRRQPDPPQPVYTPTATIKDIMDAIVDPSADVVWNAVATVITTNGVEERAPHTDEEWADVRRGVIRLVEATNLLVMPGRHVARSGEKSEAPGVELEPEEMEALVNKDRAAWIGRAKTLHDISMELLRAADEKDAKKLFEVGDRLDTACENCHVQYWYPNEKIPPLPSELQSSAR